MPPVTPGAPAGSSSRLVAALAVLTGLMLAGLLVSGVLALASGRAAALSLPAVFFCPLVVFGAPLVYLLRTRRRRA